MLCIDARAKRGIECSIFGYRRRIERECSIVGCIRFALRASMHDMCDGEAVDGCSMNTCAGPVLSKKVHTAYTSLDPLARLDGESG